MDALSVEELLAPLPEARRLTAEALRDLVHRVVPGVIEAVRPGWRVIGFRVPVGRRTVYFGFVMAEAVHVHLGFEYGIFMDDPEGVLRGTELKRVRFVTLLHYGDIPEPTLVDLVNDAVRLASLSRSERVGALLDREDLASSPNRRPRLR